MGAVTLAIAESAIGPATIKKQFGIEPVSRSASLSGGSEQELETETADEVSL